MEGGGGRRRGRVNKKIPLLHIFAQSYFFLTWFLFYKTFRLLNFSARPLEILILNLCTVYVVSPSSVTLFFLIPLLLPHSEPGYDRWRGELSVGCVWWLLWYCLNLLFSLRKMIWNLNSTRPLVSVPEGFRAWNHFALCPRLSLSWSDVSEARGSPGSTLGAPRSIPPSPLPWHGPFCSTPSAFISASPSPRQCSPRWLLSLLPNLSSPSSPLSLEVLGTKLPSVLSKVVLCPGRSQRFGMNHRPLSSPGPLLRAPG